MRVVKSLSGVIYKYLEDTQVFLVNSSLDRSCRILSSTLLRSSALSSYYMLYDPNFSKTLTQLAKIKFCRAVHSLKFLNSTGRFLLASVWSLSLGSLCFCFFIKQLGSQTLEQKYVVLLGDKWSWKKNTIKKMNY